MKYYPAFFLGLLLCLLTASHATAAPSRLIANLDAGKSQTLVLYGTSLTQFGRWADITPGHGGLADWLAGLYGNRITVINSGMAGKGSNSGVAKLDALVLAHHPNTVLIEFSINDAFTGYTPDVPDFNISLDQSKANLNAIIDRILAADPTTEIILQTMNPTIDINNHTAATQRPHLADYYQVYRDVAAARGLLLIDNYPHWVQLQTDNPAQFQTDLPEGLHPISPASLAITLPAVKAALLGAETP